LLVVGSGRDLEGGGFCAGVFEAADVADDACEEGEQRSETVGLGAVLELPGMHFIHGGRRALGWGHGIPSLLGGLILVRKEKRAPRFNHMPLHVVSEHAQEDVRSNPVVVLSEVSKAPQRTNSMKFQPS